MKTKITPEIQNSLDFINSLCEQEIIAYPIDYESYYPSNQELAETFRCWFGSDRWSEGGDVFIQFGQDGTGSLFLLWFYPSLKTEPPVVFLGSEGESCIIAPNINDFIQQLASGKLFVLHHDNFCFWIAPEKEEIEELDWQKLKVFVESKLGKNNISPEEIRDRAIEIHPNFTSWVENNTDY